MVCDLHIQLTFPDVVTLSQFLNRSCFATAKIASHRNIAWHKMSSRFLQLDISNFMFFLQLSITVMFAIAFITITTLFLFYFYFFFPAFHIFVLDLF